MVLHKTIHFVMSAYCCKTRVWGIAGTPKAVVVTPAKASADQSSEGPEAGTEEIGFGSVLSCMASSRDFVSGFTAFQVLLS